MAVVGVGIVPALDRSSGGMFQYSEMMLQGFARIQVDGVRKVVLPRDPSHPRSTALAAEGWQVCPLFPPRWRRRIRAFVRRNLPEAAVRKLRDVRGSERERSSGAPRARHDVRDWLRTQGVDILLFPAPDTLAFEAGIPSIMAIHDLQHRLQPEFPEVSANGEAERREYLYRNAVERALLILVDSDTGKEDVVDLYGDVLSHPGKVKVLPFVPAPAVEAVVSEPVAAETTKRLSLPPRFLFYPAQFWPHKNHLRIVEAIALLHERGIETPVVFTGFSSGTLRARTFSEVIETARRRGIEDLVHVHGYVSDLDLSVLYTRAQALIMPTFFGPTNIPILEAWHCDCPVLTSGIRGIREQVGDAAILVDPRSVDEIADGIARLWSEDALRRSLIEAGRSRLRRYTPADYQARLKDIVEEARARIVS